MDVDLDYQLIEVGGVTIPVFLPKFWSEEEGAWITLSYDNPLPITVKNHQDFTDLINGIISKQGGTITALNTLSALVGEMSLMATGPQGEQGIQGEQGVQGVRGPEGIQGPQGEPGEVSQADFDGHVNNKGNPHEVTKDDVGLSKVTNDRQATVTQP